MLPPSEPGTWLSIAVKFGCEKHVSHLPLYGSPVLRLYGPHWPWLTICSPLSQLTLGHKTGECGAQWAAGMSQQSLHTRLESRLAQVASVRAEGRGRADHDAVVADHAVRVALAAVVRVGPASVDGGHVHPRVGQQELCPPTLVFIASKPPSFSAEQRRLEAVGALPGLV